MGLLQPHVRHRSCDGERRIASKTMDPVLVFLAIAITIIAVAILLSWMFRKSIRRDKQDQKAHERNPDGLSSGVGTGIGIEDGDNH